MAVVQRVLAAMVTVATGLALVLVSTGTASAAPGRSSLVVHTDKGKVRGVRSEGVDSFLGIRYAAAPTGALRWEPPRPAAPWAGVQIADRFGNRCPAAASTNGPRSETEDCLFVNVQRPTGVDRGARRPVYVFIHGGGLVNGSSGLLRQIDSYQVTEGSERIVQRAWVEFDYESIGQKARSGLQKRYLNGALLTPITRVEREIPTKTGSTLVRVTRCQFPLVVCEAITIHKSQGQSYDQVVVDVNGTLDLQLLYTACSRARTAEGLFLIGTELKFPQPRSDNHPVSVELDRLEKDAKWSIPLPLVSSIPDRAKTMVIGYQNLPYLKKHSASIVSDHNLANCDLLCFVETHAQSVHLDGFVILAELPAATGCHGIVIYSRSISANKVHSEVLSFGETAHFEFIAIELSIGVQLLIVYSSPKVTSSDAIKSTADLTKLLNLTKIPLLVLGDFNVKLHSSAGATFEKQMQDHQMKRITQDEPTTDYRTTIYWVFASFPSANAVTYESFVSDHKPVIIVIK